MRFWWLMFAVIAGAGWLVPGVIADELTDATSQAETAKVDFRRDIRPILSEHCFKCHGPDANQREADLRLDRHDDALQVIEVGEPDESELIARVESEDDDVVMPPPDAKMPLSETQRQLLRRWVRQGVAWETHWAFDPIVARPPDVDISRRDARSVPTHSPIDLFVQRRLDRSPLEPSPEADRRVLVRRLYLDLTGLPPQPADVERFVHDRRPDAYARLVDRLLSSPKFGERMAWPWLDAARYADSNGYQGDGERTMWPWRDWVVDAFNRGMPFDQFTVHQLAGDLLPDATDQTRLATGFCRNHMINGEGGRIPEENRVDYVMDMTETMGTVWLGLTLNCCRCHDHKFDPLTQKDYYQFFAYFNQTPVNGAGGNGQTPPVLAAPTREQREQEAQLVSSIEAKRASQQEREAQLLDAQGEWEHAQLTALRGAPRWVDGMVVEAKAENQQLELLKDGSVLASGDLPRTDTYQVTIQANETMFAERPAAEISITAIKLDALQHASHTENGLSRNGSGNFVLSEFRLESLGDEEPKAVELSSASATFEQGDLKAAAALDGKSQTGWGVWDGKIVDRPHSALFVFKQPLTVRPNQRLRVTLEFQSPHAQHIMGRFRLALTTAAEPALEDASQELLAALTIDRNERNDAQRKRIRDSMLADDTTYQQLSKELDELTGRLANLRRSVAKVMVMEDRAEPRSTFVLNRGLYNDVTEQSVTARLPGFLTTDSSPIADTAQNAAQQPAPNRLQLAEWIVSRENPLTARVIVNRYWQQLFGIGLVRTVEDLGVQGELPEHAELLDWLAADFRDNDWDVKHLLRRIVMSHTYRQSSRVTQEQWELDPENRLLARGARYRLPAWMIRDQALAASGLLVDTQGGPAVNGYQPPGVWEEATFGKKKYQRDSGPALYRRSLYTFWRRIVGPTMFFDNASRQTCTVKTLRTNTPLHALFTLNDVTFVEASRALSRDVLRDEQLQDDSQRLTAVYRRILGRAPNEQEIQVWLRAVARSQLEFATRREAAEEFLTIGELPRDESLDPTQHAAWTALVLALLNLDETVTRQ